MVHVLDARTFDPDHEQILAVPTPFPGMTPFPPRLSPGSIRTHQSTSSTDRTTSLLDRPSLIYDEDTTSVTSRRRMSELHAQLSHGARRNFRPIEMDNDLEPEEDDEDNPEAGPNRSNSLHRQNRQSESPRSREEPIGEMTFTEPMFGEFSRRRTPELPLSTVDRMWGESEDRNDLNPGSSLTSRGSQFFGTGVRASRSTRGGYSWAVRSRLPHNLDDDDACLEGEGGEQGSQPRPMNSSSRTTSTGARLEWGPPSTSTSSSRQIQLNGSSIRVLSVDDDRSSRVEINSAINSSSTPNALLRARD